MILKMSDIPQGIPHDNFYLGKQKYATLALSYDSEVTSAYTDGKYIYESQLPDESLDKIAFPYVYMIGLNSKAYYTHNINELKFTFDKICEMLAPDEYIICYIHNAPYDFAFLANFIYFEDLFALKQGKPIKFRYKQIEFRCSYILDNRPLDKLGEDVGIPKLKGSLDYNKFRTPFNPELTQEELAYCEHDVLILNEYFYKIIYNDWIAGKQKGYIPLTKTSKVRYYTKSQISDYATYHAELRYIFPSKHVQDMLYLSFRGGWVHGNIKHVEEVIEDAGAYDLTSDYPYHCLIKGYPISSFKKIENDKHINLDKYCYLFHICLTGVVAKTLIPCISTSKIIEIHGAKYDNGMVLKADYIQMVVGDREMAIIMRYYNIKSYKILEEYRADKGYLPNFIIKSIEHFYIEKKRLKQVVKELKKAGASTTEIFEAEHNLLYVKEMLNSIYGMMVTNPCKDMSKWDPDLQEWYVEKNDYHFKWSTFLAYQWGCWVTQNARFEILSTVMDIVEEVGIDYFLYGDTDSIKFKQNDRIHDIIKKRNEMISSNVLKAKEKFNLSDDILDIGLWDYEGDIPQICYIGAKKYVSGDIPTVAGVSKEKLIEYAAKENKEVMDIFYDGLLLDPKDSGKLTTLIYYTNQLSEYILPDGNTIKIGSFIHLEPTTFKISMAKEYKTIADKIKAMQELEAADILGGL